MKNKMTAFIMSYKGYVAELENKIRLLEEEKKMFYSN
jgi:hypothetical protein